MFSWNTCRVGCLLKLELEKFGVNKGRLWWLCLLHFRRALPSADTFLNHHLSKIPRPKGNQATHGGHLLLATARPGSKEPKIPLGLSPNCPKTKCLQNIRRFHPPMWPIYHLSFAFCMCLSSLKASAPVRPNGFSTGQTLKMLFWRPKNRKICQISSRKGVLTNDQLE